MHGPPCAHPLLQYLHPQPQELPCRGAVALTALLFRVLATNAATLRTSFLDLAPLHLLAPAMQVLSSPSLPWVSSLRPLHNRPSQEE